ncbi:hypothetical protein GOBAR_DD34551 [Gossypium barbadense]|nr:hypothetical protein GOBAR_DD34551 [Gossypium barbadense]
MLLPLLVAKIKHLCDLLAASGHPLTDSEQDDVVLVGMFVEFDVVVTMVAFALEPMRLDRLVEVLLDCENRHKQLSLDSSVQVNMCQICGRLGHLTQRCYYRFDRLYDGPSALALLRVSQGFVKPNFGPYLGYSVRPSINHVALNGQVRLQAGSACVLQATNVDSPVAKGGISWALQPDMRRPIRLAPMATAASAFWEVNSDVGHSHTQRKK